jgi:hypothetical protein
MRRLLVVGGALLVGGVAWGVFRSWSLASSECFYVLLPPLYLILYLEFSPSGWHGLKTQLQPALLYVAGLAVFFVGYSYFMAGTILPATSGVAWSLRWFSPLEVAVGVFWWR